MRVIDAFHHGGKNVEALISMQLMIYNDYSIRIILAFFYILNFILSSSLFKNNPLYKINFIIKIRDFYMKNIKFRNIIRIMEKEKSSYIKILRKKYIKKIKYFSSKVNHTIMQSIILY